MCKLIESLSADIVEEQLIMGGRLSLRVCNRAHKPAAYTHSGQSSRLIRMPIRLAERSSRGPGSLLRSWLHRCSLMPSTVTVGHHYNEVGSSRRI